MENDILIRMKTDFVKKNGTCNLYFRVKISAGVLKIPAEIDWEERFFDAKNMRLLPRNKKDTLYDDYNLILRNELSKMNEILIEARLTGQELTIDEFKELYYNFTKRKDFISFLEKEIAERHKRKNITWGTWKTHRSDLLKIRKFQPKIEYRELTPRFIVEFDKYCQKLGMANNSLSRIHRMLKAYITRAIANGIRIVNPYEKADIRIRDGEGNRENLMPDDLRRFIAPSLSVVFRRTLRILNET